MSEPAVSEAGLGHIIDLPTASPDAATPPLRPAVAAPAEGARAVSPADRSPVGARATPAAESTADTTIPTLRSAILVLSRRMRYRQANDDISSAEAAVLGRLGQGPKTPGQLAKAEHVRPPSMTRTIERLEDRGYVRREADPNDGRQTLVFRTPAGDEFTARSRELRTHWLAGQFDKLDPADQHALHLATEALRRLSDLP